MTRAGLIISKARSNINPRARAKICSAVLSSLIAYSNDITSARMLLRGPLDVVAIAKYGQREQNIQIRKTLELSGRRSARDTPHDSCLRDGES